MDLINYGLVSPDPWPNLWSLFLLVNSFKVVYIESSNHAYCMPAFKLFPIYFLITSLWEFQNWMNMCYGQFSAGQKYQLLNERSNVMNRFEKWCLNHFMKMGKRESSPGGKVTTVVIYECYNGDPAQQSITEQKQKACWTGMSLITLKASGIYTRESKKRALIVHLIS